MPKFIHILSTALLIFLSACGGNAATQVAQATAVPIQPSPTPADTATATPLPSNTPAPTNTATMVVPSETPSETPSEIPAETSTEVPTENPTEAPTEAPTATAPPSNTPAPALPNLSQVSLQLTPFVQINNDITYLTHAGDGSGRIFITEKQGRIMIIENGTLLDTPFLDINDIVNAGRSEQGLLSVAFSPDYATSGEFYVNYTDYPGDGDTVVARYRVSDDPNRADPASAQVLLTIDQPAANHNGGQLKFGPDGYLYIGTGDGGRANDPWDNAESMDQLLGKMLRLHVQGEESYAIPFNNPFLGQDTVRPEIWAYGLRNPWRFSFDRQTGDLYIADVGQNQWEEINFQPASSPGGEHYGWDTLEASSCFEPNSNCDRANKVMPVAEYDHSQGCSVTGGYVYRGQSYPHLSGTYLYADYCSGRIWGLRQQADGAWEQAELLGSNATIASFGEDETGELYVVDLSGMIYRLESPQ